jgi:hypothetical protein
MDRNSVPPSRREVLRIATAGIRFPSIAALCKALQPISLRAEPGGAKKVRSLRILLAPKTDNQGVSERTHSDHRPAEPPRDESYACFLKRKHEIEGWLRSGYSIKGVWAACRRASPPFRGSYQTFWRYCRKHGLSVPRGTPVATSSPPPAETEPVRKASRAAPSSPKIWPRISGMPREFVPRTED